MTVRIFKVPDGIRAALSSRAGRVVQIAITIALAGWIVTATGSETLRAIQAVDLKTFGAAVVLFASAQVFGGLRLAALFPDHRLATAEAIVTTWIGYFASTFLPSTIGGDVIRAMRLNSRGVPMLHAAGVLVLDRLLNLCAVIAILCAAGWSMVLANAGRLGGDAVPALCVGLVSAAILIALLWRLPALRSRLAPATRPLLDIVERPGRLIWTIALSFMSVSVAIGAQWLLAQRLGMSVTLLDLAAVICAVTLVVLLPVSLNGLGVQEGSFVVLLTRVGAELNTALAFALLSRALILVAALIGAAFFAAERLTLPRPDRER